MILRKELMTLILGVSTCRAGLYLGRPQDTALMVRNRKLARKVGKFPRRQESPSTQVSKNLKVWDGGA